MKSNVRRMLVMSVCMVFLTAVVSYGGRNDTQEPEQTRPYHVFVDDPFLSFSAFPGDEIVLNVAAFVEPGEYVMAIDEYSFTLAYNSDIITFDRAVPDDCLSSFGTISTTFSAGLANGTEGAVAGSRSSEGPKYNACRMAEVTFMVETGGQTALAFPDVSLRDPSGVDIPFSVSQQTLEISIPVS